MPTRRSGASKPAPNPIASRASEVIGLILIATAVFIALALWSFHPNDPSWAHRLSRGWAVHNYGGTVGAYLAGGLAQLMGAFAVLVPLGVFVWGLGTFAGVRSWWPGWQGLGGLMIVLSGTGLFFKAYQLDPLFGKTTLAGGLIGYSMAVILETHLGRVGSWVVLSGALLAAVVATTGLSLSQVLILLSKASRWLLIRVLPLVKSVVVSGFRRIISYLRDLAEGAFRSPKKLQDPETSSSFWNDFRESWGSSSGGAAGLENSPEMIPLSGEIADTDKAPRSAPALRPAIAPAGGGGSFSGAFRRNESFLEPSFGSISASADSGPSLMLGPAASEEEKRAGGPKMVFGPAAEEEAPEEAVAVAEEPIAPAAALGEVEDEIAYEAAESDEINPPAVAIDSDALEPEAMDSEEPEAGSGAEEEALDAVPSPEADQPPEAGSAPEAGPASRTGGEPATRKGPKEGIRIGRREQTGSEAAGKNGAGGKNGSAENGAAESETPMIIPALEPAEGPEDLSEGIMLKKALSEAQAGKGRSGVRVRHAGSEGESEIVRIEDDSIVSDSAGRAAKKVARKKKGRYVLPTLDLFAEVESSALIVDEGAIRVKSTLLEKTLREFGVEGEVSEVKTGPVITIYEFTPAPGVKVSKIASLSDDLARSLSAISIRVVAPIPGTNVVGIEVPNAKRRGVRIKELLASKKFERAKDKLTLGLGKDILGRTVVTDLAKIPHLLIAGSTGSGKSVAMNLMICSLLVRCHPREVRLLMIDPKMLEFSIYEGVPHLLVPVITDPKRASSALRGLIAEMESRYQLMSKAGVRKIDSYNDLVAEWLGPKETARRLSQPLDEDEVIEEGRPDFLPYIVVVIDELADLMMVSSRDVEETMTRLAQMARAAGIHLLVATQRPSVDVLTGLIKANFPSRIALRVASRTDSRTILDMNGAERLLGKGDMLFVPPGTSTPVRIHGAFVSEKEIRNLVECWRDQGPPAYRDDLFAESESKPGGGEEGGEEYDERYDDAVALVARTGEASISLIQRHLRIGYNRAARLIERMESEGIVGPSDGAKRRQVLIRDIPEGDIEPAD